MGLITDTLKLKAGVKGFQLAKGLLSKRKENGGLLTSLINKGQSGFLQEDNYFQNSKATSLLESKGIGQNALATAGLFAGGKIAFDALTGKYRTNGNGGFLNIAKNVGKSAVKGLLVFGVAKQGYKFLQHPSLRQGLKLAASVGVAALGTKLLNKNQEQTQSFDQTQQRGLGGLLNSNALKTVIGAVIGYTTVKAIKSKTQTPQLAMG